MEKSSYVELRYTLLSAIVLISVWRCGKSEPSSRIILPQGPITGIRLFSGTRSRVNAYLGIPYALPPIGDLRFAAPARHPGWNTPYSQDISDRTVRSSNRMTKVPRPKKTAYI
ncbi:UNVERIFIED_CONTAM: hypothetical protein PYX00_009857 [Menopon gallinae]|uniref:Carboxylesterase type B domain-containing protein n=1 Tax=Menopon gallinae TaxID=328185 RepID=A0AAW2HCX4_9NEOP